MARHSSPQPPPQPPPPPTGKPDRRALLQAYQDVVKATRRKPARIIDKGPVRRPFLVAMGVTAAILVTLLVFQPGWLFTRPPAEPPPLQEASLRLRMFVEIEHIDRFSDSAGRLPTSLLEAGGDTTGLIYLPAGEGYTLSGKNGVIGLTYSSGTSAESFLGNSYQLVRGRGQ